MFWKGCLKFVVSVQTHHTTVFVSLEEQPPLPTPSIKAKKCSSHVINRRPMWCPPCTRAVQNGSREHFIGKVWLVVSENMNEYKLWTLTQSSAIHFTDINIHLASVISPIMWSLRCTHFQIFPVNSPTSTREKKKVNTDQMVWIKLLEQLYTLTSILPPCAEHIFSFLLFWGV